MILHHRMNFIFPMLLILGSIMMGCGGNSTTNERYIAESDTMYTEDVRSISKRINDNPSDAKLYATRANTFYYEDNFGEAIEDISYAIKLEPKNAVYHFKKGEYLMRLDTLKTKEVKESFETALELQPDFPEAAVQLAKIYIARQEYNKAEVLLSDILYKNKTNAQAYFYRGISKKEQGDTLTAVDAFTQALIYKDDYLEACMQLGDLYAIKGNDLALQYFNKALAIDEFSYEALYSKGLFLQKKQQYKDALIHYEKTVEINPGHRLAYYNMAYIHLLFENYTRAIEYSDEVINLDPGNDNAYYLKGLCFEMTGDQAQAKELYEKSLEVNPNNELAKNAMVKMEGK